MLRRHYSIIRSWLPVYRRSCRPVVAVLPNSPVAYVLVLSLGNSALSVAFWLSRDPLQGAEMKQGPNLYCYVGNEPIDYIDSLGLKCDCVDSGGNPTQGNLAGSKCCTGAPPMSNTDPNPYTKDYTYWHRSARQFFSAARNGAWSNSVRSCLACMYKHGASPGYSHLFCYLAEGAKHPISVWGDFGDAAGTFWILPSQ